MMPIVRTALLLLVATTVGGAGSALAGSAPRQESKSAAARDQEQQRDREAARLLKAAVRFFQRRQFSFAADTYREFLQKFPDHPRAHEAQFFLAESLLQQKQYEAALKAYQRYIEAYPQEQHFPWARFRAGEAAYLAQRWQTAIPLLRAYLDHHPEHRMRPYALRYLGEALLRAGKEQEAAELLESALRLYGRLPLADHYRYALAQIEENRGKIELALQYYTAAGQGNSEVADDALLAAGTIEYDRGRYAHARQLFETLLQRFPDSPLAKTAHFNNGLALYRLKGYQQAATHFQLVQSLGGDSSLALEAGYWLGKALAAQGKAAEAIEQLLAVGERAVRTDGDVAARAWNEAARLQAEQGEIEKAIETYLRIPRELPEHELAEHAMVHAAQLRSDLGHVDDCIALANDFFELYPNSDLKGAVALAVVRAALAAREADKAEQWLPHALKAADKRVAATARYYSALLKADRRELGAALKELESLLNEPDTVAFLPEAYFLAGRCAFGTEDYETALRNFSVFLQARTDHDLGAYARGYRAICYAQLGRADDALRELDTLQKANPTLYVQTKLACADAFYGIEAYDVAARLYDEVAASEAVPAETAAFALAGAAWAKYYNDRAEEALRDATRFLGQYKSSEIVPEMLLLEGYASKKLGQLEQAIAAFRRVTEEHPDSPLAVDAMLALARTLTQAQRFVEAAAAYAACLERLGEEAHSTGKQARAVGAFDQATIRQEYAWVLWKAGRGDEALKEYRLAIRAAGGGEKAPEAALNAAQLLIEQRDAASIKEATALLSGVLKRSNTAAHRGRALLLLARASVAAERWSDAERYARQFLDTSPAQEQQSEALYILVEALYEQGKSSELAKVVQDAVASTPPTAAWWPNVQLRQVQVLIAEQDWQAAVQAASRLVEAAPSPEFRFLGHFYRGRALMGVGQLDRALDEFQQALKSPSSEIAARAQFMIGEVHFARGAYEEAIREFLKVDVVYEIPRWRAAALVEAGKCYEKLNQPKAAADLYRRVLREFPDAEVAREAKERLSTLEAKENADRSGKSTRL